MTSRIWVTWETQRRNHTMSRAFNARLFKFDLHWPRALRYPFALLLTAATFIRERPSLIFVQNPSVVLTAFAILYGRLLGIPVVVDAHNAGVRPFDGANPWANRLAAWLFRTATVTIVSNAGLAHDVRARGGRALVLPDPIPTFNGFRPPTRLRGAANVLFISSWAADEPYVEVLKAARLLDPTTCVYISGRSKGREQHLGAPLPSNVILTGYLGEADFVGLLHACDVVIDLTTREDCLVCGAYEAVAAEKPLIVSATRALQEFFSKGTLYTHNTATDLAAKIRTAVRNRDALTAEVRRLKAQKLAEWQARRNACEAVFATLERGIPALDRSP